MGDPCKRMDDHFNRLIDETGSSDVKILLQGMHYLALTLEELNIGLSDNGENINTKLIEIESSLKTIASSLNDLKYKQTNN